MLADSEISSSNFGTLDLVIVQRCRFRSDVSVRFDLHFSGRKRCLVSGYPRVLPGIGSSKTLPLLDYVEGVRAPPGSASFYSGCN